jgi:hypothetical protein
MAISSAGSVLNVLALLTYLYEQTRSPLPVGLAVLLNFLPVVLILPILGARLGGWSLRLVTGGTAFIQAAIAAVMAVTAAAQGPLVILFAASSALGLLTQVLWIAVLSALPKLLRREQLNSGNVILQVSSQTGAVLGAFGLVVQGSAAAWTLFLLDAVTYLVQGVLLTILLRRAGGGAPTEEPNDARGTDGGERSAVDTRVRWRELGLALLMPAGFVAMNVLNVAIPLIVYSRLHAGLREYAATEMVYPIVAILAGIAIRRRGRIALPIALGVIAMGFVGLAFAHDLVLLIVSVAALGGSIIGANVATQVLAQTRIPPDALPRIQARASVIAAVVSGIAVLVLSAGFDHNASASVLIGLAAWYAMLVPLGIVVRRAFETRTHEDLGVGEATGASS